MPIYAGAISAVPTKSPAKNLFVYGTLMDKRLLYQLTGKFFSTFPAVLRGFKKLDSHLGYPYILPYKTSKVEGLLIKNIDPESIKKLDRYEGQLYSRKRVAVVWGGKRTACEVYVGKKKLLRLRS